MLAVYKPMRGEAPLWDFPDGTLHRREVAAFELVARPRLARDPARRCCATDPSEPGSVQRFVRFDPAEHFFTMEVARADEFRRVALFDLVANNADRKGGHCLLGDDGEVWMIDHGVCFAVEPKLRTVIWTFVDEPFPPRRAADLRPRGRATSARAGRSRARFGDCSQPDEVEATARTDRGVARARAASPSPSRASRPFPWPPI